MGAPHIEKRCRDCDKVKPVEEFYRARRGRDAYCRACRRARDLARSKPAYDRQQRREYKLLRNYGITLSEYNAMVEEQGGVCAICLAPETRAMYGEEPRLVVDHNHDTGKVRALLCASCNGRLASIEDEQFMLLAKDYLRTHDGYAFVGDTVW